MHNIETFTLPRLCIERVFKDSKSIRHYMTIVSLKEKLRLCNEEMYICNEFEQIYEESELVQKRNVYIIRKITSEIYYSEHGAMQAFKTHCKQIMESENCYEDKQRQFLLLLNIATLLTEMIDETFRKIYIGYICDILHCTLDSYLSPHHQSSSPSKAFSRQIAVLLLLLTLEFISRNLCAIW